MDDHTAVIFLGLIALASVVQAGFLISLGLSARRLARRVDEISTRIETEIRPSLESLAAIGRNSAELSQLAAFQGRRLDAVLARTLDSVEDTRERIHEVLLRPLGGLGGVLPLLKAVRRGWSVYRQLGGLQAQGRGASRRYREDEHLFIG